MEVVATRDCVQIGSLLKLPIQFFRTPHAFASSQLEFVFFRRPPLWFLSIPYLMLFVCQRYCLAVRDRRGIPGCRGRRVPFRLWLLNRNFGNLYGASPDKAFIGGETKRFRGKPRLPARGGVNGRYKQSRT